MHGASLLSCISTVFRIITKFLNVLVHLVRKGFTSNVQFKKESGYGPLFFLLYLKVTPLLIYYKNVDQTAFAKKYSETMDLADLYENLQG